MSSTGKRPARAASPETVNNRKELRKLLDLPPEGWPGIPDGMLAMAHRESTFLVHEAITQKRYIGGGWSDDDVRRLDALIHAEIERRGKQIVVGLTGGVWLEDR